MSAEVKLLFEHIGPIVEPPPNVVSYIRKLLERAERGEIKGILVAYVSGNDNLITNWESGVADGHRMMAAVSFLQHEYMAKSLAAHEDNPGPSEFAG